jgi:imidazole glycerol-phosphate synthase subunit HisH
MVEPVIIDYGGSNLRSVIKALEHIGATPRVVESPDEMKDARALVLPGVGAAGQIMDSLRRRGFDEAILDYVALGRPFLGVCMGMQVLLESSEEDGGQPCLGIFNGAVQKLPPTNKVPHMGWNTVTQHSDHALWSEIPDDSYFYFVHSYAAHPADRHVMAGATEYGVVFASAVARDNVLGTQFHPEKSGKLGLQIYRNFLTWASK